jgi:hypothetical protein
LWPLLSSEEWTTLSLAGQLRPPGNLRTDKGSAANRTF